MRILYIGNKLSVHGKSPTTIDTLGPKFEEMGFHVYYSSSYTNKLFRLVDMVITTIRNRNKVDCVCIDTYSKLGFYFTYVIAALCQVLGLKYIPFLHGGKLPDRIKRSPRLSNFIFNNSYTNVSPSNYLHSNFIRSNYKSELIPNSIPLNEYNFKNRDVFAPKLLFVRHLAQIYNPQMAVRVVALLKKTYPNVELNIVGEDKDGSLQECINLSKELGVSSNIIFSGRLTKNEWHALSEQYDIFINTTTIDNTPVSVIEAMALGLPVISTNVGGLPFLIDNYNSGILVESNNVTSMVNGIEELIEKPEVSKRIVLEAKKIAEECDWERVKEQWYSLFKFTN